MPHYLFVCPRRPHNLRCLPSSPARKYNECGIPPSGTFIGFCVLLLVLFRFISLSVTGPGAFFSAYGRLACFQCTCFCQIGDGILPRCSYSFGLHQKSFYLLFVAMK